MHNDMFHNQKVPTLPIVEHSAKAVDWCQLTLSLGSCQLQAPWLYALLIVLQGTPSVCQYDASPHERLHIAAANLLLLSTAAAWFCSHHGLLFPQVGTPHSQGVPKTQAPHASLADLHPCRSPLHPDSSLLMWYSVAVFVYRW